MMRIEMEEGVRRAAADELAVLGSSDVSDEVRPSFPAFQLSSFPAFQLSSSPAFRLSSSPVRRVSLCLYISITVHLYLYRSL